MAKIDAAEVAPEVMRRTGGWRWRGLLSLSDLTLRTIFLIEPVTIFAVTRRLGVEAGKVKRIAHVQLLQACKLSLICRFSDGRKALKAKRDSHPI